MRNQRGFSLIELLIVVAIILIIAAIAIPGLMRSRMLANESAAASTIRTLNTAEATFTSSFPGQGFANNITQLGSGGACPVPPTIAQACLIDDVIALAPNTKSGYVYQINSIGAVPFVDFVSSATPTVPNTSGGKDYCSGPDVVIRFRPAAGPILTTAACQPLTPLQN